MRMPSHQQHSFAQVPRAEIQRSMLDRSHGHKTTFDAGYLIPMFVDEALPGDTFNLSMSGFARLATPLKPLMDNMTLETFFFFVPNRLLWTNWQRFNGEQDSPTDSTDFVIPQLVATAAYAVNSLHDYLGLPLFGGTVPTVAAYTHSALWHRAYNRIWQEWFRDQNLQVEAVLSTGDGPDTVGDYVLRRRGKRHDYFTSCLPWPQKGDSVLLPLGTLAPVMGIGSAGTSAVADIPVYEVGGGLVATTYPFGRSSGNEAIIVKKTANPGAPDIYADLSAATAATINELRQAFQIQKLLERDARGGTRYTEIIRSHFGVTSPDARLQRPEYLGGGSSPVLVSPIAQTSSTDVTTPQGNLAAVGTVSWNGHGFTKSFTEHGIVMGLVSVRADLNYQQGLERMWSRSTRYDFYWPALAHIGEQAVLNKEIFTQGTAVDDEVFGYQERYAEYRYKPSKITGLFRSGVAGSLEIWHLAQDFATVPVLGNTFIQEDPPVDRVIAVPSEPHFLFDSWFKFKCARPMPVYGVPGLIDHF